VDENRTTNQQVGWDDTSLQLSDLSFFKGEKGSKKRIHVMTAKPYVARVHYHNGYFLCHSKFELQDGVQVRTEVAKCCSMTGANPTIRFGVVVLVYDTKKDGSLKTTDPTNIDFDFQVWVLSADKFNSLKNINAEWGLDGHDLSISCSEEQYQKLEIQACKNALWKTNETFKTRVEKSYDLFRYKDPSKFLGKALSEGEIVVRLGGELDQAVGGAANLVNETDFDSVLADLRGEVKEPAKGKKAVEKLEE
jgi:hypothetical protein